MAQPFPNTLVAFTELQGLQPGLVRTVVTETNENGLPTYVYEILEFDPTIQFQTDYVKMVLPKIWKEASTTRTEI